MGTSSEETDRSSLASERAGARARALDRVARARNGVAARTCFSVAAFIWGFVFAGPIGAGPPRRFAGDFFAFAKPRAPIAGTAIDATAQAPASECSPARTAPRDAHRAALDAAALATRLHIARRARVCAEARRASSKRARRTLRRAAHTSELFARRRH